MKKILILLILAILFLNSCDSKFVEFPFDEDFKDWSGLEPVIKNFDGELFGDKNITVDGYFAGCEKLGVFGDMLHCNDDGATIWFDKNNGSLYRLKYNGQKEKICPDEECRNNINGECNHMQIFNYIYNNGFLYFTYRGYDAVEVEVYKGFFQYETRAKIISKGVFIYRYDIDKYEYEKLIEFQGIENCDLVLNGRYLYAQTYTWESSSVIKDYVYKADFNITRIDLFQENAVVVYSDLMNREDFDKICDPKDFKFIGDKIIMPVNNDVSKKGSINICNVDMQHIITLIEFENEYIRDLYLYGDDIYFISDKGLSRVNMDIYNRYNFTNQQEDEKIVLLDSKKREILKTDINSFCIDGDFLYYTLFEFDLVDGIAFADEREDPFVWTKLPLNTLYRINLDYSRDIYFGGAVAVYTPKPGEDFNYHDWKVCAGYLYATINTEDNFENSSWRARIKLNSNDKPYLFYKEY
ncbi:MAG: hypothetical protein FWF92_04600 [Oscillospiraceae bacterium]|nr:hypothetical protein [Oscillospiraceae bacterium]